MTTIPNLIRNQPSAEMKRLYSAYLSRLAAKGRYRRSVEACRQIRAYAKHARRLRSGDFTYQYEIDALCKLGRFSDAWRQLRRLERIAYGKNINLKVRKWRANELDWFWHYHPQILYFLGRYQLANRLLEALFAAKMSHPDGGLSYELLPHIYKPVPRPRDRHDVTLYHVYRKLGKKLLEWPQWEQFVNGFDPKLFTLAHVQREDLLRDVSLLRPFYEALSREQKQRLIAKVSAGEHELIDPPEDVRRFQNEIAAKRALQGPVVAQREKQLKEIFPELQRLG